MKKDQKIKQGGLFPAENKKGKVRKLEEQQLLEQENLLFKADEISPASKHIDGDEIIQLRGGMPLNISAYIRDNFVQHSVHFFKDFFYALADTFQVERSVMDEYVKPQFVPRFINRYIYGRFPNLVLIRIREKNPLLEDFSRPFKNFQFLTDYADRLLREFIDDATVVLKDSKSYKEFREKFVGKFGVPNQTDLFDY